MDTLRVVIAPSGFYEQLSATNAIAAIAEGVRAACPTAQTTVLPLVDGDEGFTETLVGATGGTLYPLIVTGPLGQPAHVHIGILGGAGPRTVVLDIAAAAGLQLVPHDARNPLVTTTYGVGELIRAALDIGAQRILVGCGDSGTNDGGAGMAEALGARLLRADNTSIARGGVGLAELARIDLSQLDPRLQRVSIDVACNTHNILCGKRGVARVFGPQKGATQAQVLRLESALEHYATILKCDHGYDVRLLPGGGASGGLAAGLHALCGATLHQRSTIVLQYLDLDTQLARADLVIMVEGNHHKVPSGLDAAIGHAYALTASAAERVVRMFLVGRKLAGRVRAIQPVVLRLFPTQLPSPMG